MDTVPPGTRCDALVVTESPELRDVLTTLVSLEGCTTVHAVASIASAIDLCLWTDPVNVIIDADLVRDAEWISVLRSAAPRANVIAMAGMSTGDRSWSDRAVDKFALVTIGDVLEPSEAPAAAPSAPGDGCRPRFRSHPRFDRVPDHPHRLH